MKRNAALNLQYDRSDVYSESLGYAYEAQAIMNDEGDIVPLMYGEEPSVEEYAPVVAFRQEYLRDIEDEAADKRGSYELGRLALGVCTVNSVRRDNNTAVRSGTAKRRRSRPRCTSGPQFGEETAKVVDQRLSPQQQAALRHGLRTHVAPVLEEIAQRNAKR